MNFFMVNQCGLYKNKGHVAHGLGLEETFDLIFTWAKDRPLRDTLPWNPLTVSKSNCYCSSIYKDPTTGDFVIVLWKSNANSKGAVLGVEEDATNGEGEIVKVTDKHRNKKMIWGNPCYYWIIPSQNSVISIKFEESLCDSQMFQDWVIACITSRVGHHNKVVSKTEGGFARISFLAEEDAYRYGYRFDVSLRSTNTSNVELDRLAKTITHVIRRETILINVQDERASWLQRFDSLPFASPKDKSKQRKLETTIEAKPTVEEIREIIEKFARENRKASEWDNVGFQTTNGPKWVDRYRLKDELNFPAHRYTEVLTAASLWDELKNRRHEFIEPIIKSENITSIRPTPERKVAGG